MYTLGRVKYLERINKDLSAAILMRRRQQKMTYARLARRLNVEAADVKRAELDPIRVPVRNLMAVLLGLDIVEAFYEIYYWRHLGARSEGTAPLRRNARVLASQHKRPHLRISGQKKSPRSKKAGTSRRQPKRVGRRKQKLSSTVGVRT